MPLPAVPVLLGIGSTLFAIGKWLLEMALMYGRKIAFYAVVVAIFFSSLYTVSSALFATFNAVSTSSYYQNVAPYMSLASAVFPSNFLALAALAVSIEFQIFFWRWAMKVLDIKVSFFG